MGKKLIKSLPDMSKARNRVDRPVLRIEDLKVGEKVLSFAKGKKYWIHTFGCQANVRDEETMAGYLEKAGFVRTYQEEEADLAIINTCAVRENAEEKVYGEIGKFKANHLKNPSFVLGVCGCMMQEEKKAETLIARYPFINLVFGTHNISSLLDLLEEHLAKKKDIVEVFSFPGDIVENLPSTRLDEFKAYVNITYGCDKFCTYCIVPYTRGRERSRALSDILKECRELVEQGYQEITLLGQNVNSYGKDFGDGTNFALVLEEVAKLGIPRLRFMTSHPWDFTSDMLRVIAKYPNIMKCIHLPVQSGSTEMLRIMGRRYSREDYLELVRKIRAEIPGCALTTDIIVGFPNETEEQFQETLSLCREVRYDAAFTFIYSPRAGTPAAKMVDNVSSEVKHRRFDELVKVIEEGVVGHADSMVGNIYSILVDGPSKKDQSVLSGYTESGKLVHFKGPRQLRGHIVPVKILESHAFSLFGELQEDPWIILAKDLSASLQKGEAGQRYFEAKKAFDASEEIILLRRKIEEAQRAMAKCAATKDDLGHAQAKKEYESANKLYIQHPLTQNLVSAGEEARNELLGVVGELS